MMKSIVDGRVIAAAASSVMLTHFGPLCSFHRIGLAGIGRATLAIGIRGTRTTMRSRIVTWPANPVGGSFTASIKGAVSTSSVTGKTGWVMFSVTSW